MTLNEEAAQEGLPEFQIGIGVNTGTVIAGTLGGPGRLDYTVLGDAVNIAQRLQATAVGGEILAHPLRQLTEQPIRADQLDALLPRLGDQLLGHPLLVQRRLDRRLSCCFGCHVVDRVSHGLTPFGFQTSQFHR